MPFFALLLLAVLLAFLWFNVYGTTNKIFLGDTGSLILGLLIAVLVIQYNEFALLTTPQEIAFSPIFSLAILATPLADMIRSIHHTYSEWKVTFRT